jgi:hypothetical protein
MDLPHLTRLPTKPALRQGRLSGARVHDDR